ncbi:MAG: cache domain-containing protein, partial [Rudaea sp.]
LFIFDGGVITLNNYGTVVAAQPPRPEILGQDWSDRDYFRQMIRTPGTIYSNVVNDGPRGAPAVAVAVPVTNPRGELVGTLLGMFRVSASSASPFYGSIVRLRVGGNNDAYLVDHNGIVIYHSQSSWVGKSFATLPAVQQVAAGNADALRTRDANGRDIVASFAPVPGTPWGLVTEQSWASLLASGDRYRQFLFLLLGLGVLVPAVVVAFGVNRITDPIRQLIAAAGEIAGGKFGQQIPVRTGDELEELAGQFNAMSRELAESYGQLEDRVAARTKELATLIEVAEVVSGSLDLKEIMHAALGKAQETMQMEVGSAYSLQDSEGPDEDKCLVLAASRGLSDEFFQRVGQRRLVGTAIQVAAGEQQPKVWTVEDYPDARVKAALEIDGVRQVINVPLLSKGKLVGAFNIGTREPRAVTPEQISLLASIGHQVAVAVENARLYDQAEQTAAMAERNRLSRELHDSVTQSLYSMTLYAEATARLLDTGQVQPASRQLRELRDTAQEALREMRLLIFQLRLPALGKSGLVVALQERIDSVERRSGIQCRMHVQGEAHLPSAVQEEFYHTAQEALNNALKHARAHHIQIDLCFSGDLVRLESVDDGVGFDPDNPGRTGGLGLRGMRERAQRIGGQVDIFSKPGKGTRVRVEARVKQATTENGGTG